MGAIRKVRAGLMPPAGLHRPDAAAMKAFAASLESSKGTMVIRVSLQC